MASTARAPNGYPPDKSQQDAMLTSQQQPRELAPYAQKLAVEFLVLLASLITMGATIEFGFKSGRNRGWSTFAVIVGLFSAFTLALILYLNYMCEISRVSRSSFTHKFELQLLCLLAMCWVPGVAILSSSHRYYPEEDVDYFLLVNVSSDTGIAFGWLSFFGTIYAVFKAYHTLKEHEAQTISEQDEELMSEHASSAF